MKTPQPPWSLKNRAWGEKNMQLKYLHPWVCSLKTHRVFLWADLRFRKKTKDKIQKGCTGTKKHNRKKIKKRIKREGKNMLFLGFISVAVYGLHTVSFKNITPKLICFICLGSSHGLPCKWHFSSTLLPISLDTLLLCKEKSINRIKPSLFWVRKSKGMPRCCVSCSEDSKHKVHPFTPV